MKMSKQAQTDVFIHLEVTHKERRVAKFSYPYKLGALHVNLSSKSSFLSKTRDPFGPLLSCHPTPGFPSGGITDTPDQTTLCGVGRCPVAVNC